MSLALNPFREFSVEIDGVTTLVEAVRVEVKINDELMLLVLIDGTINEFVVSVLVAIELVEIAKAFIFPAYTFTELSVDTFTLFKITLSKKAFGA
jgi:hypothetical protein